MPNESWSRNQQRMVQNLEAENADLRVELAKIRQQLEAL
jgi:hypothetical protein